MTDLTTAEPITLAASRQIVSKLSRSSIFKDYERSFGDASGLPMTIRPIDTFQLALRHTKNENPFCVLMASTNKSCAACLNVQQNLQETSILKPNTLKCFAGMCDSAVPIRVGENLVAFLQTGQVLLHDPDHQQFSKVTRQLIKWGTQVDLKRLEEAYFQSKVLEKTQYNAFVRLLATFAEHLSIVSNEIMVQEKQAEPQIVSRVRNFVSENYDNPISLGEAARIVNTSSHYFCKMFKKATGMTFTEYLTRTRVEKAKNQLLNPNKRISEIAYEVGFESLSQFNRSFKRFAGQTPSQYREEKKEWN